jgi:hypothetical protein
MNSVQQHEDSPADIHIGCGDHLLHSLQLLPYQSTLHCTAKSINRTAVLSAVYEKNTNATKAVSTNLHFAKGLFHM